MTARLARLFSRTARFGKAAGLIRAFFNYRNSLALGRRRAEAVAPFSRTRQQSNGIVGVSLGKDGPTCHI
ncbi:Hypothetical protein NTJ_14123 [Nesidiocoris tenuis]|uniref:Uncharacterized protein n=1 Tax=Nesidiocoris tenuis TaxID=355587 RepID=A0ABN7BA90_9HEMI|nr:Hypothetical protein NTJ_14123 [Nesidiocoris tenuis]